MKFYFNFLNRFIFGLTKSSQECKMHELTLVESTTWGIHFCSESKSQLRWQLPHWEQSPVRPCLAPTEDYFICINVHKSIPNCRPPFIIHLFYACYKFLYKINFCISWKKITTSDETLKNVCNIKLENNINM